MDELVTPPGALRLSEVRRWLAEEGLTAFAHRHGSAFLVYRVTDATAPGFARLNRTVSVERPGADVAREGGLVVLFPVRPSGRSPFPDFVSVGRAPNNDIIIREPSLSKFHAYFRLTSGGGYVLHDAGSQNGTFLDEERVPAKEEGPPAVVSAGSRIRFGGSSCTFVLGDGVQALARAAVLRG